MGEWRAVLGTHRCSGEVALCCTGAWRGLDALTRTPPRCPPEDLLRALTEYNTSCAERHMKYRTPAGWCYAKRLYKQPKIPQIAQKTGWLSCNTWPAEPGAEASRSDIFQQQYHPEESAIEMGTQGD